MLGESDLNLDLTFFSCLSTALKDEKPFAMKSRTDHVRGEPDAYLMKERLGLDERHAEGLEITSLASSQPTH